MKIHFGGRLFLLAAVLGVAAVFAVALLVVLEVRSVVAGPEASPGGPVPNPGHAWNSIQDHGTDGVTGDYWLGTTDLHALELRVNNARALRLEPNASSPNVIGGYSGNSVTAGVAGAAICGGGWSTNTNRVTDDYGTVGGGGNNQAGDGAGGTFDQWFATVGGGYGNTASGSNATVGGGGTNTASGPWATVGGGRHQHGQRPVGHRRRGRHQHGQCLDVHRRRGLQQSRHRLFWHSGRGSKQPGGRRGRHHR